MTRRAILSYYLLVKSRSHSAYFAIALLMSMFIASKQPPSPMIVAPGFLAGLALGLSIYVFNDLTDCDTDTINKIVRPIQAKLVTRRGARLLVLFLSAFALSISLLINSTMFMLFLAALILGVAYSWPKLGLKKKIPFKTLMVGSGALLASLSGGAAVGEISGRVVFASALAFAVIFMLSTITDLLDIEGDRLTGVKSVPVILGVRPTVRIILAIPMAIGVALTLSREVGFGVITVSLGMAACVLAAYSVWPLNADPTSPNACNYARRRIRLVHILLQSSLVLGNVITL